MTNAEIREELEGAVTQLQRWAAINFLVTLMTGLTANVFAAAGDLTGGLFSIVVGVPFIALTWRRYSAADRRYDDAFQRAIDELMR